VELSRKGDFTYEEYLVKILEIAERVIRSWMIRICKVQWNRYSEAEATWERENDFRESYPELFVYALLNLEDEILLRGVEFVTPKKWISINRI